MKFRTGSRSGSGWAARCIACLMLWAVGESGAQEVAPPNDRQFVNDAGNVRITTAVPSAAETRAEFGVNLYGRNIQPVWLRIENRGTAPLWFLPIGLDQAYFTPIEVSHRWWNLRSEMNLTTSQEFFSKKMGLRIAGGEVRSGYVFSRLDEGTKSFNVDVLGSDEHFLMTFFVPVPGLRLDHYDVEWSEIYSEEDIENVDVDGLVSGLEALACCVTDRRDRDFGDPLNIALIGNIDDVYYAFLRAGWDETETIYGSSLLRMLGSALSGSEYRYSPVSALYVFGRAQDVAFQKARESIDERNHLRLWLTPMRYEGKPVWIGQISRDIGVRFTRRTITTHKIDPDVDETREYLLEDLAYAQSLEGFGYVGGVGPAPYDQARSNLTGDPYFTDGLRAVFFIADEPVDIAEIEVIDLGSEP
jgi:hypothetical protein